MELACRRDLRHSPRLANQQAQTRLRQQAELWLSWQHVDNSLTTPLDFRWIYVDLRDWQ